MSELTDEERIETLDTLYTAAGTVRGREAMKLFLRDLLTESERLMLGRRILIARMLLLRCTYAEIGAELQVGQNTIRRIEIWLQDQLPGYEQALEGLEKEYSKRAQKRDIARNPFGYAALKKKYPLHFLLFPTSKSKKKH